MDLTDYINEQLDQVASILNELLVPDHVNAIYDHRTLPSKLPFVISLSYLGGNPGSGTAGGFDTFSNFALVMEAHHDKSEESLRWSERQMNRVETLIIKTFQNNEFARDGYWISCEFYKQSTRPPSPTNYPDARLGHIYLRLNF